MLHARTPRPATSWLVVAGLLALPGLVTGCKKTDPDAGSPAATSETPAAEGAAAADDPLAAPPDVAAPPADAEKTATGLASKVLRPGTGTEHPAGTDKVKVHYTGWTTDGKRFDSSLERGEPAEFPLNRVIAGWTEGVQLMVKGEKRRFWIPEDLAYRGQRGAPAGMLVFDIELLDYRPAAQPPEAPSDVGAIPDDAEKSESGLAWRVLEEGTGTEHPLDESQVRIQFSGWTSEGRLFGTTTLRGRPQITRVDRLFPGWAEGVKLMVEGEKRRLWVPEELAYAGRPGAPPGMLVLDVELVEIVRREPATKAAPAKATAEE